MHDIVAALDQQRQRLRAQEHLTVEQTEQFVQFQAPGLIIPDPAHFGLARRYCP